MSKQAPFEQLLQAVIAAATGQPALSVQERRELVELARADQDPVRLLDRMTPSIVDRLTFDASIIETGTESFRLRTTKRRRGSRAS